MLRILISGFVCVAALGVSVPTRAASFSFAGAAAAAAAADPGPAAGERIVAAFDGADTLAADLSHSSGFGLYSGINRGVAVAPIGDTSRYMAIGAGGSVLFDLRSLAQTSGAIATVSVYVGSVDRYNFIDVLGTDSDGGLDMANPLLTSGGAANPFAGPEWGKHPSGRLTFSFDLSDRVGALVFRSTGVAFEFDSIAISTRPRMAASLGASAVPEPASWALMLGGFGAIGSAVRRRKSVFGTVLS